MRVCYAARQAPGRGSAPDCPAPSGRSAGWRKKSCRNRRIARVISIKAGVKGVRSAHKVSSCAEVNLVGARSTGMTTETMPGGRVNVGEFDGKEFLLNLDRAERADFYKL